MAESNASKFAGKITSDGKIGQGGLAAGVGGTDWQSSIVTASTLTAVAGRGYTINTTSNACTVTLPGSASVGDTIQIVDYAGTFATNNITLTSSLKIEGGTGDKILTTNREGVTITYADATQGWVATSGVNSGDQAIDPITYSADFLVIAGGGSGGKSNDVGGSGGGAGGYRNSFSTETSGGGGSSEASLTFNAGTVYTITIGAGGAGVTSAGVGNSGVNSSLSGTGISTITSIGGGAGVDGSNTAISGGSGGGAAGGGGSKTGASGTANQGYAGGNMSSNDYQVGGGGGGAGAVGGNGTSTTSGTGGNGGAGLASSITGSSVTRTGGGGGSADTRIGNTQGTGGSGGGGAGGSTGVSATVNTGSGGGGGGNSGAGGSGVIILRMPTASYSSTTSGSPTVSTDGTDTILIYNASGSYTA